MDNIISVEKLRLCLKSTDNYATISLRYSGMLQKFKVSNFKGFDKELVFDLNAGNYSFSVDSIKNNIVNHGVIYGDNGSGKSNLGLALFDIVLHLTDKEKMSNQYLIYLNGNSGLKEASFEYTFVLNGKKVVYNYKKTDYQTLTYEKLMIDDQLLLEYDFISKQGINNFKGAESLKIDSGNNKLSKLKYINNNAILEDNDINKIFVLFMNYVDRMLLFKCLDENGYQGLMIGNESLDDIIVSSGHLNDFEKFLRENGVHESLSYRNNNGKKEILMKYKNGSYPFNQIASTGSKSLEVFYYWYLKIQEASFIFIDEFDAFYHYKVAENIVKTLLYAYNTQTLLTTHNTDLLSNDILRPDCYFILNNGKINSLPNLTNKDIRYVHNIQKLFKAGAFDET